MNKQITYTPGPWHIALPGGPQGPFYGLVNSQGHVVATQIVGEANARLIAAAPELLAVVKMIEYGDPTPAVREQAWKIIAKIEGRQP